MSRECQGPTQQPFEISTLGSLTDSSRPVGARSLLAQEHPERESCDSDRVVASRSAEFNVLGPVTATVGDASMNVGGPKQRVVLAALIASAGSPVSTDTLLHTVYGEHPPERGRRSVQTYVSTLRSVVRGVIVKSGTGWSLEVDRSAVDAARFEDAHESALNLTPFDASALLREALGLWRGLRMSTSRHTECWTPRSHAWASFESASYKRGSTQTWRLAAPLI